RAGADWQAVAARLQPRPAGRYHVNLVLGVRVLVVGAAARDRVGADAQVGYPEMVDPVVRSRGLRRGVSAGAGDFVHCFLLAMRQRSDQSGSPGDRMSYARLCWC